MVFELYEKVLECSQPSFRAKSRNLRHLNAPKRLFAGDFFISPRSNRNDELFYENLDKNLKAFINDNPLIFKDNDTVMIVKDIHRDRRNEADWERLKNDENVRLSIDCWRFGLIFIMDRIKKEHYILKV